MLPVHWMTLRHRHMAVLYPGPNVTNTAQPDIRRVARRKGTPGGPGAAVIA